MRAKWGYTSRLLMLSLAVGAIGFLVKLRPLLPISTETKASLGYPKESLLNVTERALEHGYLAGEHNVVTDDGYKLKMFRLQRVGKTLSPPVLLMHGLLQSSASWLDSGPDAGLAYLLADAGFDVWLGNTRGTSYSRRHVSLDPDEDPQYWNFTVDEIGRYDLPAFVDRVLAHTGAPKLNYIGFSQGAGSFYVMCSERPEYCRKVKLMIGLAPAARQTNTKSVLYRALTISFSKFEFLLNAVGVFEVFSKGAVSQEFVAFFCQLSGLTARVCEVGADLLDSKNTLHTGSINEPTLKTLFGNFPAGTSVHNLARYGQSMVSPHFEKYNYGRKRNMVVYGSEEPPKYNLSAVTVPVLGIYGKNDGLVDVKDVKWLHERLPNVLEIVEVKDPLWNHLDVTYGKETKSMIFPKIQEYLLKYSSADSS